MEEEYELTQDDLKKIKCHFCKGTLEEVVDLFEIPLVGYSMNEDHGPYICGVCEEIIQEVGDNYGFVNRDDFEEMEKMIKIEFKFEENKHKPFKIVTKGMIKK